MSNIYSEQRKDEYVKEIKVKPIEFFQQQKVDKTNSDSSENAVPNIQEEIQHAEQQLKELKEQKKQLVKETEEEINLAKQNWNKEKESYIEQANKEGYKAGFTLGKNESMNEYKTKINEANLIIQSAQDDYYAVVEESEQKIVDLAIHTAEKIIKQNINENPKSFLPIVTEAIKEIKDQPAVFIYLHPNNYTHVLKEKKELNEVLDGDTKVSIYIDQDIEENDCIIKHSFGQIDASIHTQLEKIHHVLNEVSTESIKDEHN